MTIIDQPTTGTATDLFAPGRTVWVPAAGRRAAVISACVRPGEVYTLAGSCFDAIPLPSPGEALAGGGYFIGWASSDETDLTGLVSDALTVTSAPRQSAAEWDARHCLNQSADPLDSATLLAMLTRQVAKSSGDLDERIVTARREGYREAEEKARQHLEQLVYAAHEWADQNEMCEKFDEFCQDWNLPLREHEFDVNVTLTLRLPVRLTATGSGRTDDAYDAFRDQHNEDTVWRMIRDQSIDSDEVEAYDVQIDDVERVD